MAEKKDWKFVHDLAKDAKWTPGLHDTVMATLRK